jgi:hypothetical protein
MKTFNKSLIAFALVGISSTASAALTFTPTAAKLTPSIDSISTAAVVTSGTVAFKTAANYGAGDTIALTSNIAVDATQAFATTAIAATGCPSGKSMSVSFAGYDASTKVATYTVQAATDVTAECIVTFPGIKYDGAVLADADIATLALSTSRGFGVLESVAAVEMINVAASQFSVTVAAADETIDVNANRNAFVGGDATDVITLTTTTVAGAAGGGATYVNASSSTVVSGDFSWAKTVAEDGTVSYPAIAVGGTGSAATFTDSSITFLHAIGGATITFTPPTAADDLRTLPATTYSAVTTVGFTDADSKAQTKVISSASGDWDLNGASITALGISNSPSVTPMVWIQNAGTSNGAISGSVNCNGTTITIADLGTASAKSNTKVGEAIQAAVDADGTCSTVNTRYDATVTVNGPAADITMNASYKVTAADGATDRVMLETSDSLPSVSN